MLPTHDDPAHRVRGWAQPFATDAVAQRGGRRQTVASMTAGIRDSYVYLMVRGPDLIRVAVARQANEVAPVSGEWYGCAGDFAGISVVVQVHDSN